MNATDQVQRLDGSTLKAARVLLRMTQEELARLVKVSQQRVSDWETGRREPTREELRRLLKALE